MNFIFPSLAAAYPCMCTRAFSGQSWGKSGPWPFLSDQGFYSCTAWCRRSGLYLFLYVFFRQRQIVPERKEPPTLFAPVYQLFPVDFRGFFTCFITRFFLCVIFQYRFSTVFQLHFCQLHGRPFCGTSKCASALA